MKSLCISIHGMFFGQWAHFSSLSIVYIFKLGHMLIKLKLEWWVILATHESLWVQETSFFSPFPKIKVTTQFIVKSYIMIILSRFNRYWQLGQGTLSMVQIAQKMNRTSSYKQEIFQSKNFPLQKQIQSRKKHQKATELPKPWRKEGESEVGRQLGINDLSIFHADQWLYVY